MTVKSLLNYGINQLLFILLIDFLIVIDCKINKLQEKCLSCQMPCLNFKKAVTGSSEVRTRIQVILCENFSYKGDISQI